MSSSAAQIAHAAVEYSTFASLRLGRTVQSIVARLIRFWDSRNVNKNVEFMGIRLLLLEEMDSVIHAFTPANRASHYRPSLKAGCIVRLERFEVAQVAHMYKVTEHQFLICFLPSTRLGEVHTDAPVIKSERFMMRRYDQLQVLAKLPDVVGEIRSVQGSDLSNDSATTRVVVRFLIEPNVTVYLTLWDEAASTFRDLLKSGDKSKAVVLVTTVNPKLFGGNLYLNSTQGTSVGAASSPAFTCVDTLEGIKRKEPVSIGELNAFISNSDEQTQEADFLCKALVVGVNQENGWFRVELAVDDGKDSATFVVFDKEMTKLTGKEAAVLALDEDPNGEGDELPRCLEELAGKEFVFQIRVTPFNFTPNHRTFTVSTITECNTLETCGKEHDDNIIPNREVEVTLAASSSGQSVLGNRTGVEYAEANPPEVEGAQKKRKLSSE
uniref:Replication protein A 70 kDa DNA-binding subunit B/D first OB fold domain-containing protein n=1 Tax=Brassica oleracea var. oleracea TaxID=109376 RepID=A0A0D2ZUK4_BRAOL